jgi:hypothetical protein
MEAISPEQIFNPYIVLAMHKNTSVEVVEQLISHFDMQTPQGNEVQLIKVAREFYSLKFGHSTPSVDLWRGKNQSTGLVSCFDNDFLYPCYVRDAMTESLAILNFHVLAVAETASVSMAHYAAICLPAKVPSSIQDFLKPHKDIKDFFTFLVEQIQHSQEEILGLTEACLHPIHRRLSDALPGADAEGMEAFELPTIRPHLSKSIGLSD